MSFGGVGFKMANWTNFVTQVKALPIVKQRAVSAIVGAVVADAAGSSCVILCPHDHTFV